MSLYYSIINRLIVNPHVLRCLLRPSLTEAPSLRRSYPASSVLRTSPPPHTARPVSRELPVDPYRDHRWGFPGFVWSPMRTCHRHYPGRSDEVCSLVYLHRLRPSLCNSQVGSCNCFFGACSAFTHVMACTLAESPSTLSIESSDSFVASAAASIATGWSGPVPGRELHPLKSSAFHGALLRQPAEYSLMMGHTNHKNPKSHSHSGTSDPKVNLPDENGWTPLMKACNRESLDKVRRLIAAGADVHKADADRFGPMMCACVEGRANVCALCSPRAQRLTGLMSKGERRCRGRSQEVISRNKQTP